MSNDNYEQQVKSEFIEAFTAWAKKRGGRFLFEVDCTCLISIIGNLQLALRHPNNVGPSARAVRQLIDQVIAAIELEAPYVAQMLRRGDNPAHDQMRELPS
jgi:hypothetical protein